MHTSFVVNQIQTMLNQNHQPLDMLAQIASDLIRIEDAMISKKRYEKFLMV